MPEMSGLEATLKIREHEGKNKHTPILALTADALPDDQDAFIEAGMDDVLIKPVDETQLLTHIRKHVRKNGSTIFNMQQNVIPNMMDENNNVKGQFFSALIRELPEYSESMKTAFENNTFNILEELAHRLHGHASYCNVPMLKSAILLLERATKEGNPDKIRHSLLTVNDEINLLLNTTGHT